MMCTLIKNELIKIFRRSKTWIVFGLFLLLTIGTVFIAKENAEDIKLNNSIEGQIKYYEDNIKNEEEFIKTSEANGEVEAVEESNEYIKNCEKQIEWLKEMLNNKDNPDSWKESLKKEKEELQAGIDDADLSDLEKAHSEDRIEIIDICLEKDIKPIEDWEFNGINFILQYMQVIGVIILVCGIAVFMSDIVSGECTPATLKFLLVQPISRAKVILAKFIAVVVTVVALISGLQLIVMGVLSAFTGLDASKMPTIIGTQYEWDNSTIITEGTPTLTEVLGSGHIVTKGSFLAQSFGVQLLFIICCCAFVFMISCIFKSSMITMAISVVVSVFATMVPLMLNKVGKIAHLSFFSYGDPTKLINGDISVMYNNSNFSITTGIIVMLVTTVVSYLIGHIVFKKRDILI